MITFSELPIPGAYLIQPLLRGDERGFFARAFCQNEFQRAGLDHSFVQMNLSHSRSAGTLRGLHYQLPPAAETKLVTCVRGRVYDVILDLRPRSSDFGRWCAVTLSPDTGAAAYVPRGCAHALFTLDDDTEVLYLVTEPYTPELERGVRYNDERFALAWPFPPRVISPRDLRHPDFDPTWHLNEEFRWLPVRPIAMAEDEVTTAGLGAGAQ